ncbi:bifunctional DNA primase/polymerase [Rubellimicrobium roseum]|uniref:DNA primase/polymerase bifunctional N-terminal domain-containing protein n=1 Tax=Rubellimicrobium roseum TaxID=687525 RepID=A0A5C4NE35_9RHOB|nr:bifunctional DNA primase/polymerase [Rubellimicrobium roseum]TNC68014.1 hypothetical protein FHG71_14955 [Rubellimicrobium roseum]
MTGPALDTGAGALGTLTAEIARLHHTGFSLLPLGRGADGKSPLVSFQGVDRLPLRRVLAPMHRTGSTCYGVRLIGLVVVDCDTDDPALVSAMETRFGASPIHVRTPRGRHLYYRAPEGGRPIYPNLRDEGLAVDLKRGANAYVMGPGSLRPDGGAYVATQGLLGLDELPVIRLEGSLAPCAGRRPSKRDESASQIVSRPIAAGARHDALKHAAIGMVEAVTDPDALFDALLLIRDRECENPEAVSEEEVRDLAEWAWRCRLEGRVYAGRHSDFRVNRLALDLIGAATGGTSGESDAVALYVRLIAVHGHRPGYAFALHHEGMRAAGHTTLSRERFTAARSTLLSCGLLRVATNHSAGRRARTYQLCRPQSVMVNVTPLHGRTEAAEGEGAESRGAGV